MICLCELVWNFVICLEAYEYVLNLDLLQKTFFGLFPSLMDTDIDKGLSTTQLPLL